MARACGLLEDINWLWYSHAPVSKGQLTLQRTRFRKGFPYTRERNRMASFNFDSSVMDFGFSKADRDTQYSPPPHCVSLFTWNVVVFLFSAGPYGAEPAAPLSDRFSSIRKTSWFRQDHR